MDNGSVRRYLQDFQAMDFGQVIGRDTKLGDSAKIQTVIGGRRAGKTYLLFGKMKELEGKGAKRASIVYLNFENPALSTVSFKDFKDVIELHWSIFPESASGKLHIFIDEPQALPKWESAVRGIYDEFRFPIFITGSSSKLLSKEIATSLRGRSITTVLLPLSFGEFLRFRNAHIDAKTAGARDRALLQNHLSEFLRFGGFPEVVLAKSENEKLKTLKDYFDLAVYKDIIDRYSIKNTHAMRWMVDYVVNSASKEVSLRKMFMANRQSGMKTGKNTFYNYFSALQDSFFAMALRKFDYSRKNENLSIPKIYLNDFGFMTLFSLEEYGRRLENAVFLKLLSKTNENPLLKLNYWKSKAGKEVDFVMSRGKKPIEAIQAAYSLQDSQTMERETGSLYECMDYFKLTRGTIITFNEETETEKNGKKISITPAWKWLLEN